MLSLVVSRTIRREPRVTAKSGSNRSRAWPLVAVLAWCAFLFFYGLGNGELYRTESLRAIVAQHVLRSGDWIVPTLYGEPLLTKPPGMYAAIALASLPLGHVTEWTARLPSALAATIVVLLIYGVFRREIGPRAGLWAGLITPVSLLWLDKSTAADIDMMQAAWVTGAIVCFLRALEAAKDDPQPSATGSWWWWMGALLCVAGGVLTKWTAPVFFYGTVVPLLWWRGRVRLLFCAKHLLSAALGASICLAWVVAVVRQCGWDVFYRTVAGEALQRLAPSHHVHRLMWLSMMVHPLVILAAGLPASALVPLTLRRGFARRLDARDRRLWMLLHCWVWPNLLFWSLLPQHNTRYFFPLAPGLSGMAALAFYAWERDWPLNRFARLKPRWVLAAMLIGWLGVKLAFVHGVIPARLEGRQAKAKGESLAVQVPAGETLYLFRLKDEGILFYYGRPARRLATPQQLTSRPRPAYCILDADDWRNWPLKSRTVVLLQLTDEQQEPIRLVRLALPK